MHGSYCSVILFDDVCDADETAASEIRTPEASAFALASVSGSRVEEFRSTLKMVMLVSLVVLEGNLTFVELFAW